jgi:hypothetical protein
LRYLEGFRVLLEDFFLGASNAFLDCKKWSTNYGVMAPKAKGQKPKIKNLQNTSSL